MIRLDTFVANELGISLNHYIYNSISVFKYNIPEINDYINKKCIDNPLISIDEDKIPLSVLAHQQQDSSSNVFTELFTHFNCSLNEREKFSMTHILYSLNSSGFLEAHPNTIALMTDSSTEEVLSLIRKLKAYDNNKGIGCSNVFEFLEFQLKQQNIYNERLFPTFITHLEEIKFRNFKFLDNIDIDEQDFTGYIDLITEFCTLSPIISDESHYLEPDAVISLNENNGFNITINDYLSDSIVFEPLDLESTDKNFKKEIEKYQQDYEELASILNARKMYLTSVLTIIINKQREYLLGKSEFLNPLDQNDLADITTLSPATISRLLANKFVNTPIGTLPIKALLSKKCSENTSVSYAMYLIRNLSDFETMSDSKISKKLYEFGVTLSRRTVNKYKNQILNQI